jgi:hypothetical protein
MKKLLFLPGLTLGFMALVLLTMNAGRLNGESFSPVSRSTNCPLPCWRGIQPGEIFIAQANRIMIGQGYMAQDRATNRAYIRYLPHDSTCAVRLQHEEAVVNEIRLSDCPALRLGDVMVELGRPDGIATNRLYFNFDTGRLRVQLSLQECSTHLSPFVPIDYLSLTPDTAMLADDAMWRGFAFAWRYQRLQPGVMPLAC